MRDSSSVITVLSIQSGPIAPLGPNKVPSGIVKTRREGPVSIHQLGLEGDEIADLRVHGGPDKAVYAYPASHYDAWRADFPQYEALWGPGGVGENLTVEGLTEENVFIGDVFEAPRGLVLQITQPRQPCFKFAARFADERLPQALLKTGRCGYYFRVLSEGSLEAGERLARTVDGHQDWSIARFQRMTTLERKNLTTDDLRALAAMDVLPEGWRLWAKDRLDR